MIFTPQLQSFKNKTAANLFARLAAVKFSNFNFQLSISKIHITCF